jgi:hypothetical protein
MDIKFTKANRKAAPMLLSISSVSGGGKTYSALLLAAGIAGPSGRVGFIDTENGRGEMYTDSPGVLKALPGGYEYVKFDPPFTPARYVQHIQAAERAGITVCIIDSASHEWSGTGGCCEMAENNKLGKMANWSLAKREHKKFVNHILTSPMHLIFCLRAQEKVKIFKKGDRIVTGTDIQADESIPIADKDCIIPLGLQSIAEKNFVFEQLVSLMLDERTHHVVPVKVPEPLLPLFPSGKLITKEDGERVRLWNDTGAIVYNEAERLIQRARIVAEEGLSAYEKFFTALTAPQRKMLAGVHDQNKAIAKAADTSNAPQKVAALPDPMEFAPGARVEFEGAVYTQNEDQSAWVKVEGGLSGEGN